VERQLAAMFSPQVTLKSGGYIVINQTEALVSIDVNSGKATREHNIEDTALKTNLEAAEEIARQLRLRDLAGLIVIDFIDMDERRNNRLVERRLKEALRYDRARIQVGRISHFGLLEMSRQRLRTGMLEGSTTSCPMCQGTGIVRSVESVALDILRSVEDRLITDGVTPLVATTAVDVALYILNQKRAHLKDIEARYQVPIAVNADKEMHISQFVIERGSEGTLLNGESAVVQMDWAHHREEAPAPALPAADEADTEQGKRRSRRRRRKRHGEGGAEPESPAQMAKASEADEESEEAEDMAEEAAGAAASEEQPRKSSRRRGRRGGRRGRGQRSRTAEKDAEAEGDTADAKPSSSKRAAKDVAHDDRTNGNGHEDKRQAQDELVGEAAVPPESEPTFNVTSVQDEPEPATEIRVESPTDEDATPRRRGWWSRG